ncbi:MAG TPA: DUF4214 domain-containing protein [Candidatus Binatia bacterium]|nr:DUF4214 domain-containing protein [Candidatus Binatia bacterium]
MSQRFARATLSLVFALVGAVATPDAAAVPGTLDLAFASGGIHRLASGSLADGPAVDSQGRIVVVRRPASCTTAMNDLCGVVTRLRADGTLDPTFGSGGEYLIDELPPASLGGLVVGSLLSMPRMAAGDRALFLQATLESGPPGRGGSQRIRRVDASGAPDGTFSNPGFADTGGDVASIFATYGDGRLLLDGNFQLPSIGLPNRRRALRRYLPDGAQDLAFAQVEFQQAGNIGWTTGIPLPSGGVLLAYANQLQRYAADGTIDVSFGSLGTSTVFSGADNNIRRIALQGDGKILVLASVGAQSLLLRVNADGSTDFSYPPQALPQLATFNLVVQPDGLVVVAGNEGNRVYVGRRRASGEADGVFGSNGVAYVESASGTVSASGIEAHGTGGLVLAGSFEGRAAVIKLQGDETGLPIAGVSHAYSAPLTPAGSSVAFTAGTLVSGSLPPGLAITGNAITGTPTTPGSYTAVIQVTEDGGAQRPWTFTIRVHDASSLVRSYYNTILRREPDASGQAFWESEIARLSAEGASVNEAFFAIAVAFFGSGEYAARNATNEAFVADLYQTFFNRSADAGGLAFWTSELAAGKSRGAVMNDFLFSAEFADFMARIFGSAAASRAEVTMVMDFYRGLLGRLPDPSGLAHWVGRFRSAQCANTVTAEASAISAQFFYSGEYAARESARSPGARSAGVVADFYNAFMRRGGDRTGVEFWIAEIDSGRRTREDVRQAFMATAEFQGRVQAVAAQGCLP